jgi:hypothetical protein
VPLPEVAPAMLRAMTASAEPRSALAR